MFEGVACFLNYYPLSLYRPPLWFQAFFSLGGDTVILRSGTHGSTTKFYPSFWRGVSDRKYPVHSL